MTPKFTTPQSLHEMAQANLSADEIVELIELLQGKQICKECEWQFTPRCTNNPAFGCFQGKDERRRDVKTPVTE